MTASMRRAAQQHLKRLLRGALSSLNEGRSCCSSSPSASPRQVRPIYSINELPTGPFNASFVLPRGGIRHSLGSPETFATRMSIQQLRGTKISGSEVKVGFVIERKGRIEKVLKTQHTTQGRGGALIQVELRDVQTGLKSSARLRTSEAIEKVFVDEKHYTFLYKEDETVYLMDPATFEQVEVPMTYFETRAVYLTDGMDVTLQHFDGKPLSASVPPRVTCTVAEAEPYFKGQTATPSYKRIILENGQQIMAPTFITAGDIIVVDTTNDSYVTRSKT
ncbi:unnamed protein product [Calypogeia fissa]